MGTSHLPRRTLKRRWLFCLAALASALAPQSAVADTERFVVVLKDDVEDPRAVARQHDRRVGAAPHRVFSEALKGYAASLPPDRVSALRRDTRVDFVERDGTVRALAQTLPWGANKVDADRTSTLAGNGWGAVSRVHAFVVDTGVYRHPDLNVVNHVNFAGGTNGDCHGHGTHVAGTLAARDNLSTVVGVAPGTRLTGVKVLGCDGTGPTSALIAGVEFVTRRARYTRGPDVANLSVGGTPSAALDDAVRRSAASGVFYGVAAGNEGARACMSSPARTGAGTNNGITTVAATSPWDREPAFSNYGRCVDLWAPGVSVSSTRRGGGSSRRSGTSMAAPHVTGNGALYRSRHAVTPSFVESRLKSQAQVPGTRSKDGRLIRRHFARRAAGF